MKQLALATLFFFTAALAAPVALNAQTPQPAQGIAIPIAGTGPNGTFAGTFQLQRFANVNGTVQAIGTLTGTLTNTVTNVTTSIVRTVSLPVAIPQASCDILHLDLGPLHLNLLGLEIDLNQIVLDITAQPGAGNLLGNLLCAVANLLNNPSGLANLLNQILAILG
jgi:hypothetical protein